MCVLRSSGVVGLGSDALSVVNHGGEDEYAQCQEDDEKEEFIDTGPQRVAQHSQTHEVPRQLEDPQYPNKPHHAEEAQHVAGSLGWQTAQAHLQVERQNGHKVYDVECVLDEDQLVWAADDSHQELKCEPDHTDALHQGEDGFGHYLYSLLFVCFVALDNQLRPVMQFIEGVVSLQAEGGDGHQDEKQRGERNSLHETHDKINQCYFTSSQTQNHYCVYYIKYALPAYQPPQKHSFNPCHCNYPTNCTVSPIKR